MERIIHSDSPSIGLIIGTYAAVPYVHLQLESWSRYCDKVPALVHDDCSSERGALEELCSVYDAEFHSTVSRMGHIEGDLQVLSHGLEWASRNGIELLVKFSRRFLPLVNWQAGLGALALESQYATYSGLCRHYRFGFRTECVALHVPSWLQSGGAALLQAPNGGRSCLVEAVVHRAAVKVHQGNCQENRRYEMLHPKERQIAGYGAWDLLGDNRRQRRREVLWHNSSRPREYYRTALGYGLTCYDENDFASATLK